MKILHLKYDQALGKYVEDRELNLIHNFQDWLRYLDDEYKDASPEEKAEKAELIKQGYKDLKELLSKQTNMFTMNADVYNSQSDNVSCYHLRPHEYNMDMLGSDTCDPCS